jgi:uncharacterized protein (TIGR01777 family)
MHVVITGASGFLGSALTPHLRSAGHVVTALTRSTRPNEGEAHWDPEAGVVPDEVLEAADAVVHLAGENLEGKWDDEKRRRIRESRVRGAELLAEHLTKLPGAASKTLVVASAIGYYGDRGDEELSEVSPRGDGFLSQMSADVEDAAHKAAAAGTRVVCVRIGIVQSPEGGMLQAQLPLARKGLAARLGRGKRWLSWIALDDLVRVFTHVLTTPTVSGPVNAVAPSPVTNAAYTKALAAAVGKPAFLAIPPFLPRMALGDFADEVLLQSARVQPAVLATDGFTFTQPELGPALRHLVAEHPRTP